MDKGMIKKAFNSMRLYKIIGILLIVGGIASFLFANYIRSQVDQGKHKVRKAQSAVNSANQAASGDPTLYLFSRAATGPIQKKINEGKKDIVYLQSLAKTLDIVGFITIIAGGGLTVWAFYSDRRKN